MADQEKSDAAPETDTPSDPTEKPELFSKEFFAQFGELVDHVTFNIFRSAGLRVRDDGTHKFMKPMYKREIEETLTAWHEDLITLDQMREYVENLGKGKITRYKLSSDLAKFRREAKNP